mmetsp:Transcript_45503/g.73323  ORF Transcript_45503/g.73323 Transcript_45503/m.73323 type:complete len:255 (-) Transcript_45503:27-791(-)
MPFARNKRHERFTVITLDESTRFSHHPINIHLALVQLLSEGGCVCIHCLSLSLQRPALHLLLKHLGAQQLLTNLVLFTRRVPLVSRRKDSSHTFLHIRRTSLCLADTLTFRHTARIPPCKSRLAVGSAGWRCIYCRRRERGSQRPESLPRHVSGTCRAQPRARRGRNGRHRRWCGYGWHRVWGSCIGQHPLLRRRVRTLDAAHWSVCVHLSLLLVEEELHVALVLRKESMIELCQCLRVESHPPPPCSLGKNVI